MNLSKSLVVIFSCSLFAACGNSGDTKTSTTPAPDTTASAKPATVAAAPSKGLELIGGSDCTTCHRLQQSGSGPAIGPAYSEVARKYSPAADTTIARLVKKIETGGSGVWGTIPMTPHPALKEADIKEMLTYIMSLK
ncbi:MAG: c-type cytochrome [Puia sp.]|nr:c-type cytochrome [Puia sp.]